MAKRKHDKVAIIEAFLEAKTKDPKLSLKDYCLRTGLSYRYMSRIIGGQVVLAWQRVVDKTLKKTETKLAERLASTLEKIAEAERALFFSGAQQVLPEAKDAPPRMAPGSFKDALDMMVSGAKGYRDSIKVLVGDVPLQLPATGEHTFEWNEPPKPRRRRRGQRRAKRKDSRGKRKKGAV